MADEYQIPEAPDEFFQGRTAEDRLESMWVFIKQQPDYKGIWIEIEDREGVSFQFLIARAGGWNVRFKDAFGEAVDPHTLAIEAEALSKSGAEHILAQAYSEAVVLDWRGEKLPKFEKEAVRLWLIRNPEMFDHIQAVAEEPKHFVIEGADDGSDTQSA